MATTRWLLFYAVTFLALRATAAQADIQFHCGRIVGYTEETLVLEAAQGERYVFALDEESETPVPLVVGARVQIEFESRDPCQGEPLARYVLYLGEESEAAACYPAPPFFMTQRGACRDR